MKSTTGRDNSLLYYARVHPMRLVLPPGFRDFPDLSVEEYRRWVEPVVEWWAPALDLVAQGVALDHVEAVAMDPQGDRPIPSTLTLHMVSRLLSERAAYAANTGRPADAVRDDLTVLTFVSHLSTADAGIFEHVVAAGPRARAADHLRQVVAQGALSAEPLAQLRASIAKLSQLPGNVLDPWRIECEEMSRRVDAAGRSKQARAQLGYAFSKRDIRELGRNPEQFHALLSRFQREAEPLLATPPARRAPGAWEQACAPLLGRYPNLVNLGICETAQSYETRYLDGVIALRLLYASVALQAFKAATGAYPARLSELVPSYLSAVPENPYTGEPLDFQRVGDGYQLNALNPRPLREGAG